MANIIAEFGDNLSPNSATVAVLIRRQSPNSATVMQVCMTSYYYTFKATYPW